MSKLYKVQNKTRTLVQLSLLSAIIVVMAFTPLGFVPGTDITLLAIPVAVGAILLGPSAGLYLGALFGLVSFVQCFGANPLGTLLLGVNPLLTFVMCFLPRLLMGWLCGLIYRGLVKAFKKEGHPVALTVASLSSAVLNTVFFVSALILFFGTNANVLEAFGNRGIIGIIVTLVTVNAIFEAIAALVLGTAITGALLHYFNRSGIERTR